MRSSIVALAVLLLPALAQAQLTKRQIDQAKKHFKAGMAAEEHADHETAVKEYQAAYDITKDPKVYYSIARVYENAGKLEKAIEYYDRYLKEAKLSPQTESETEAKIAALQKKLQPPEPPPEPQKPVETQPPEPLAEPSQNLAPVNETPPPADEPEASWYRTGAWVFVGVTAALLTTGGVLATSASSREEDVNRLTDYRNPATGQPYVYGGTAKEQYQEAYDEGDSLRTWSIVAFVAAGAAAGAAVTLFVLDSGNADKGEAEAAPSVDDEEPGEPSTLRIVPSVAPGAAGVSASFNF